MTPSKLSASERPGASGECVELPVFEPHVPGIDYGVLDELVGYNLRRAQIVIYEDFVRTLAPWAITPQRFSALTVISRNASLKLTELSHILGIARSGAVTLVDALAEMGYVTRVPSPSDKRAYGLVLTPLGQRDLQAITHAVCEHDQRMVRALSPTEAQQLMQGLRQVGR
jgi:DNA-binding MarR family transcriptional regulator